jgi:hypothetical protein
MPILAPKAEPFCCAICQRPRPPEWEIAHFKDRAPLCLRCEQDYETGQYGDANPDRRTIKQISALAEALRIEAYRAQQGRESLHA